MSAKQPTPPPKGDYMPNRPTSPPPPKRRDGSLSNAMTELIMQHENAIEALKQGMLLSQATAEIHIGVIHQRIEAAKQRLESLNGKQVGQAELYAVIEILEGNSPEIPEGST